jgi:hypothetical protein
MKLTTMEKAGALWSIGLSFSRPAGQRRGRLVAQCVDYLSGPHNMCRAVGYKGQYAALIPRNVTRKRNVGEIVSYRYDPVQSRQIATALDPFLSYCSSLNTVKPASYLSAPTRWDAL